MIKLSVILAAVALLASPAAAATDVYTTPNPVLNNMMVDWAEYDAACRGTNPSQGSDGFCGARSYLSFALQREGVCLGESETGSLFFKACVNGEYEFQDPLKEIRSHF
jgi:hypothetical protein